VSRRRITLLSVTIATMLALILMGSVWLMYYGGRSIPFQLPSPLSLDSPIGTPAPGPGLGGLSYTPLTVDAQNIKVLLTTIERPAVYHRTIDCISYWPGGEERITHHWAQRDGVTRVETRQHGRPSQNRIITESLVYLWTGDSMAIHTVSPGEANAEALSGVPTWETIAALPAESIISSEYLYLPVQRERCLLILTQEAVYRGEYLVSLDTGLLIRAAFTDENGILAYEVNAGRVYDDPEDSLFVPPDGRAIG
jgi:hypothetical protein